MILFYPIFAPSNEGLYAGLWSIECGDFGYADNNQGLKTLYPLGYQDTAGQWQRSKVGLSYLVTEESWLRDASWLNQLRIFSNYGVAGLYPPAYAYQRTVG